MNLPVRTTREADALIRAIDDWWRTNRPAVPDLFLAELPRPSTSLAMHRVSAGDIGNRRFPVFAGFC
jgi:hypothetical protein